VGTRGANEIYDAKVDVRIVENGNENSEAFPLRARFEEVQRRSGMIAADVLHRALKRT
jgi:hypothetical protein